MKLKIITTFMDNSIKSFTTNQYKNYQAIKDYIETPKSFIELYDGFVNVNQIKSIEVEDAD